MSERTNPFADLKIPTTFSTKARTEKPVEEQTIARIADENNFPSRQAAKLPKADKRKPRIHRTGRNQHIGIKVTEETKEKFYKALDARGIPQGELLRLALDALEREGTSNS